LDILIIIFIVVLFFLIGHLLQKQEIKKSKEFEKIYKERFGSHVTVAIKRYTLGHKKFVPAFYDQKKKKWMEIDLFTGKAYVLRNVRK